MDSTRASKGFTAPYLAWKTLFNLLVRLEEQGVPDQIDRTFLSNLSGTEQSYLMSAMRQFGLIGEKGKVLEPLKELTTGTDARQAGVRRLLEQYYPTAVSLPANATQGQLDEVFRGYNVTGERLRKAETFYLRAAQFAGLQLSPNFKSPAPTGGEGVRTPRRSPAARARGARRAGQRAADSAEVPPPPSSPAPSATQVNVHPMLVGAIQWLAENGPKWTAEQAEAWITSFTGGVRLVYPGRRVSPPVLRRPGTPEHDGSDVAE